MIATVRAAVVALCLVVACTACTRTEPRRALASGVARGLVLSEGGAQAAFLVDARHPDDRLVPDDLLLGDLWAGGTAPGAAARQLGGGVPTLGGAYAFAPRGTALAFLAAYRFRAGAGELWLAPAEGAAVRLASDATSFAWAPGGGQLAWIAEGRLQVFALPQSAGPRTLAEGVASFVWAPDGTRLATSGTSEAGRALALVDAKTSARVELARAASDFAFAPDGTLGFLEAAPPKGGDRALWLVSPAGEKRPAGKATSFRFGPEGHALALLSTDRTLGEGFGDLSRADGPVLGQKVSDWRFTPRGDLLFLAHYDVRTRAGTLTFAPAGGPPRELAQRVQSFLAPPPGDRVLYLSLNPPVAKGKTDLQIELWTAPLAAAGAPRKIDDGVYGYQLGEGGQLYWKARCGYGPRSCSVLRAPIDASTPPVVLASDVAGFDLSADGQRLLLLGHHRGAARAVDLSWLPASSPGGSEHKPTPLAEEVDPSARWADAAGRRVVFAVLAASGAGVYAVDLPASAPTGQETPVPPRPQ